MHEDSHATASSHFGKTQTTLLTATVFFALRKERSNISTLTSYHLIYHTTIISMEEHLRFW